MRHTLAVIVAVGILRVSLSAAPSRQTATPYGAGVAALRYYESIHDDFDTWLRQLRPAAPSALEKALVIQSLPKEGELAPTGQEKVKLRSMREVLAFHRREDLEIRVITVGGLALAGLHGRTVLLISREALSILKVEELEAIAAHELGHDYFWDEYENVRRTGDYDRLQELELRCDGIAVITLQRLKMNPERLVSATMRLLRYNEHLRGRTTDRRYVPQIERERFIRSVAQLIAGGTVAQR